MVLRFLIITVLLVGLCLALGCSSSPITPALSPSPPSPNTHIGSVITGQWQVRISADKEVEITSLRSADLMLNVLSFLEPPIFTGFDINLDTLIIDFVAKQVEADVILTHPLAAMRFRGFDVRGIVFGPKVTNADGLTIVMSPDYFSAAQMGYIDGLLGAPDSSGQYTGLAGYKYFTDGIGLKESLPVFMSKPSNILKRGTFSPGGIISRHYSLDWNNVPQDFMIFNYAVYANYDFPQGGTPPPGLSDFSIATANGAEAFTVSVAETSNTLFYNGASGGGELSLAIEVWDWQGKDTIFSVTVKSAKEGIIPETMGTYSSPGTTSKSFIYTFNNIPATPDAPDDLPLLVTVTDTRTFGQHWFAGVLNGPLMFQNLYAVYPYTTTVSGPIVGPKNIDISYQGMAASDICMSHNNGDVYVYYTSGVVRKFIAVDDYQTSATVTSSATAGCEWIDMAPYQDSFVLTRENGQDAEAWFYSGAGVLQDMRVTQFSDGIEYIQADAAAFANTGSMVTDALSAVHAWRWTVPGFGTNHKTKILGADKPAYDALSGWWEQNWETGFIDNETITGLSALFYQNVVAVETDRNGDFLWYLEKGDVTATRWGFEGGLTSGVQVYVGPAFGVNASPSDADDRLNAPRDITRDSDNQYYVLDKLSDGTSRIKAFTYTPSATTPKASIGDASDWASGEPVRLDGSNFIPNTIAVLIKGDASGKYYLSIYAADELP